MLSLPCVPFPPGHATRWAVAPPRSVPVAASRAPVGAGKRLAPGRRRLARCRVLTTPCTQGA
eukprot:11311784-Alexandrium_andersonii.AAC.1